ncbi:LOW QUALITY PROTEIN: phosphate-binding protein [Vibrio sp. JCM 18905]|nr:LOW QUALITY PROTEIN: phosphate-binding protein [Vibrio sp. JCM 18905]
MKPACTLLSLTLLSSPFVVSAQENIEKTFTFGIVSNKAQSKIKKSTPFTQYVTNGLAGYGYTKGAVKVFKNYRQLAVALKNGTVQIATATPPFNAMTLEAESGSQAIAIRWKKGLQKYHTVFFTHKESGIESISDLRGKTLVLKSYIHQQLLLTRYYTASRGEIRIPPPSSDDKPAKDSIGYLFLDEHLAQSNEINLSVWVYKQRVAAGAFSNFNWSNPKDLPESMKDKLTIFARSVEIPRDLILASPTLSQDQQHKITSILLGMEHSQQGALALKQFQNTKKITALTPEMSASLNTVRTSIHLLPKVD